MISCKRVSRWWVYLQDFEFTIEHRAGAQMTYVDCLSRHPPSLLGEGAGHEGKTVHVGQVCQTNLEDVYSDSQNLMPVGWLSVQQSTDGETIESKEKLANGDLGKNQFCLIGNTLCHLTEINSKKVTQYFVPKNARFALVKEYLDG